METETRKQLIQFFIITFIFSWLFWLPGVLAYFGVIDAPVGLLKLLELVGAIGPAVVALILSRRLAGKEGLRALLRSAFDVKAGWKFWAGASLMLLCLHGASWLVLTLVSSDLPTSPSGAPPLALIPYAILIFLVGGGLGEEIGWRGYALDRLQTKYSALAASLLLVVFWIVWHLPLFFYGGTNQSLIPFWLWLIPVVALGVMMTWIYNNTGTVFSAALFHTVGNLAYEIFPVMPTEATPGLTGFVIITVFYVAAAIVIVAVYGAKNLRRDNRQVNEVNNMALEKDVSLKGAKRNRRKSRRRIVLIAVAVLVIISLGGWWWFSSRGYDYRKLSWTDAFEQLHAEISRDYPFTEWKDIDWDALYAETAPRIAEAQAEGDVEAYYIALREYTFSIPDGHLALTGENFDLNKKAAGGGYGMGIIGLDDGRVITHILLEDGPAAEAGMEWGAEILNWDGQLIDEAVDQTDTLWANSSQPTQEGRLLMQYSYLVRDPVGTEISVTFQNPGEDSPQTVVLVAEDDQAEGLKRALLPSQYLHDETSDASIQMEILPGGYGYLRIGSFMPSLSAPLPGKAVDRAIKSFVEQEVPGIIIDVRSNGGGLDVLIPRMTGHFYDEPGFYQYISCYDVESGEFQIIPSKTLTIEPRLPYYGGPVMVLVDNFTMSTAEGPPLVIQRLPQGYVVGMYGTHGSFAAGDLFSHRYRMPEGIVLSFLPERSLDEDQNIQVDGNADGIGGVEPDIRVPITDETVYALFVDGVDVVLETAVAELESME